MFKKILPLFLLSFCLMGLSACTGGGEPEATIPPGITNPDGGVISTDPMAVEGQIIKLKTDQLFLKVQGVEWEILLPEQIQEDIKRMAELDIVIDKGTFVIVYYEENEDGERVATRIERLEAN